MLLRILNAIFGAFLPRTPVDVDAILTERARGKENLDWRHSIVDLMKLLDLDPSLRARKDLADELGYDGLFTGTPEQNMWLHAQVMNKVRRRELG